MCRDVCYRQSIRGSCLAALSTSLLLACAPNTAALRALTAENARLVAELAQAKAATKPAVAGCSAPQSSSPVALSAPSSSSSSVESSAPTSVGAPIWQAPDNKTAVEKGCSVTVTAVSECHSTSGSNSGRNFLVVELLIENTSTKKLQIWPYQSELEDAAYVRYSYPLLDKGNSCKLQQLGGEHVYPVDLLPRHKVRGELVFEPPLNSGPWIAHVHWDPNAESRPREIVALPIGNRVIPK